MIQTSRVWADAADWNMTPQELAATGWLDQIKGTILEQPGVDFTCAGSSGRVLDFAVVSKGLAPAFSPAGVDFTTVWRPKG